MSTIRGVSLLSFRYASATRLSRMSRTPMQSRFSTASRVLSDGATKSQTIVSQRGMATHANMDTNISRDHDSERTLFWQSIPRWRDITEAEFLNIEWQRARSIERPDKLFAFLAEALPEEIPAEDHGLCIKRDDLIRDVQAGMKKAPMSTRLTPYILSRIDWSIPLHDPIFRQFIPLASRNVEDNGNSAYLAFDSLSEKDDSPVPGLVHRYPDKVLFLGKTLMKLSTRILSDISQATSVCPVYCRFCTRSYAVGGNTELVNKESIRSTPKKWPAMFDYIEQNRQIEDVVVSGGDSIYLQMEHLNIIGERLLSIPHIRRIRFASKVFAVSPHILLDSQDGWTDTLIDLSNRAREQGKHVALHTHINHPNEISWITELAAQKLYKSTLTVRNQSVLLRNVNDDVETMSTLIRRLAHLNIEPYYVYQADLVPGVEDLRTPLSTSHYLEEQLRGTIAGFRLPQFIVDLPGGGGKRLANSYTTYDRTTGVSTWRAPGVKPGQTFYYHDPPSRSKSSATNSTLEANVMSSQLANQA
ncbi:hypothetical protein MRB53_037465 [Persea americana]|nr:hypothetical protein MRB53_037465 [Persea americana]